MANEIFVFGGEFGEGFAGRAEEENGIVAEAAHAARSGQDFAFDGAGENGDRAAATGQREHANEARAAVARRRACISPSSLAMQSAEEACGPA